MHSSLDRWMGARDTVADSARRITCVIPALVLGGAERVLTTLVNHWAAEGRVVTVVSLDDGRLLPAYPLDAAVTRLPLDVLRPSSRVATAVVANLRRLRRLRKAIRGTAPDVVVSFLTPVNILTLLACQGLRVPVIVAERSDPLHYPLSRTWTMLRRWTYPRAHRVIAQSERALLSLGRAAEMNGCVIPNPVTHPGQGSVPAPSATSVNDDRTLLAVGRLVPEKGFDLLIDAFAMIAARTPGWRLCIVGEGPERQALESRVTALGLDSRISMPGSTDDPVSVMRAADLFVLSSRVEGFPNALAEAMACGLAVVSFDCPSGPRELVRDAVDGLLVPAGDLPALARSLEQLMHDGPARARLASRGPEVVERFSLHSVMQQWERVFASTAPARV